MTRIVKIGDVFLNCVLPTGCICRCNNCGGGDWKLLVQKDGLTGNCWSCRRVFRRHYLCCCICLVFKRPNSGGSNLHPQLQHLCWLSHRQPRGWLVLRRRRAHWLDRRNVIRKLHFKDFRSSPHCNMGNLLHLGGFQTHLTRREQSTRHTDSQEICISGQWDVCYCLCKIENFIVWMVPSMYLVFVSMIITLRLFGNK